MSTPIRPTRAEISLAALRSNLEEVRRVAPAAQLLAVVKANAYGHGAVPVAQELERAGVNLFGVALVEEGLELREAGVRGEVLVLGGTYDSAWPELIAHNLIPTVFREEHLARMGEAAKGAGKRAKVHVKVDTGMGRIGVAPRDVPAFLEVLGRHPMIEVDGLLSHFANADLADAELTREQIRRFKTALAQFRAAGHQPRFRHLSNSAGAMDLAEVRDGVELNLIRPGLMLYGMAPAKWLGERVRLTPVMTWKTAISHLKSVEPGTPISYGSTWVAKRPSLIATLPVGYADGYSRMHSNKGVVLVRGARAPIAGRVCMDMCMVDVTDVPGVAVGDEVVLMGAQGDQRITTEELAANAQTIVYEVVCAVGARVPRIAV